MNKIFLNVNNFVWMLRIQAIAFAGLSVWLAFHDVDSIELRKQSYYFLLFSMMSFMLSNRIKKRQTVAEYINVFFKVILTSYVVLGCFLLRKSLSYLFPGLSLIIEIGLNLIFSFIFSWLVFMVITKIGIKTQEI